MINEKFCVFSTTLYVVSCMNCHCYLHVYVINCTCGHLLARLVEVLFSRLLVRVKFSENAKKYPSFVQVGTHVQNKQKLQKKLLRCQD